MTSLLEAEPLRKFLQLIYKEGSMLNRGVINFRLSHMLYLSIFALSSIAFAQAPTAIQGTDAISASRTVINTNFSQLYTQVQAKEPAITPGLNGYYWDGTKQWLPLPSGLSSFGTQLDSVSVGGANTINFVTTTDIVPTMGNSAGKTTIGFTADAAKWASRAVVQAGLDNYCATSTGNSTVYGCNLPLAPTLYTTGMRALWKVDTSCTGGTSTTLTMGFAAKRVYQLDGASDPAASQCTAGLQVPLAYDGALNSGAGAWRIMTPLTTSTTSSGVPYANDSGTANALIITPSPAITYTSGTAILVKIAADSTGAVTINANSLGVKNVTTVLGAALTNGALKAGSVRLLTYDGTQFQLQGTGACVPNSTGFTCYGSTSGVRTYTTEATAANDTVKLVGYTSTPTAGNCAQWSTSGGQPIMGQAAAACGSGSSGIDMTTISRTLHPGEIGYNGTPMAYSPACGAITTTIAGVGESSLGFGFSATNKCMFSYPASSNSTPVAIKDFASGGTPRNWTLVDRYARSATTAAVSTSDYFPLILNSTIVGTYANSLGIRWNHSTSNYECYIRSGGADVVATNMSVSADSLIHTYKIYNGGTANSVSCSIDGGTVTTVTGTIPANDWFVAAGADALTTGSEFTIAELRILLTGLVR